MQLPEMDYWPDKPHEWLLDEALDGLTPEECMGLFWIIQRSRTQKPPGVFAAHEPTLTKWSRLSIKAWGKAKEVILTFFGRDKMGNLHHEPSKALYLNFAASAHNYSQSQRSKAFKSHAKSKKDFKAPPQEKFLDPYARFGEVEPAAAYAVKKHTGLFDGKNADACSGMPVHAPACLNEFTDQEVNHSGASPPSPGAAASRMPPDPLRQPTPKNGHTTTASPEEIRLRRDAFNAGLAQAAKMELQQSQTKESP